ncbi:MAG TPA: hypothetical protein VMJ10_32335 [Kofleriaceae bacterium]|nr:hypothetical protein [Kofleriaceae bacterium]
MIDPTSTRVGRSSEVRGDGTNAGIHCSVAINAGVAGRNRCVAAGAHLHSAGLALDIDPKHNPYVFAGDTNDKDSANDIMSKHLRYAAQLFDGEAVTPEPLAYWSTRYSTEELFARVFAKKGFKDANWKQDKRYWDQLGSHRDEHDREWRLHALRLPQLRHRSRDLPVLVEQSRAAGGRSKETGRQVGRRGVW